MRPREEQGATVHLLTFQKPHTKIDMATPEKTKGREAREALKHQQPGVFRFLFCATGIFVCYFFYGILQEKM